MLLELTGVVATAGALATYVYKRTKTVEVKVEPRIVSAVATMASVKQNKELAHKVEKAMADAVAKALDSGVDIQDSETLRALQMDARRNVLRESK